jgi:hypothetical protein
MGDGFVAPLRHGGAPRLAGQRTQSHRRAEFVAATLAGPPVSHDILFDMLRHRRRDQKVMALRAKLTHEIMWRNRERR